MQIGFMLKYLEDKYADRATKGDKANLQNMRSEVSRLESLLEKQKNTAGTDAEEARSERGSENQSEESVSKYFYN